MTQIESRTWSRTLAPLLAAVALLAGVSSTAAATFHVANNGGDSNFCGTPTSPCRSITKAIARANANDTISVGPGVYGRDLDGDGIFGEPGDEAGGPCAGGNCLVRVNKSVKIVSTEGAGATLLRGGDLDVVVSLESAGAELGKPNKGFTVSGAVSGSTAVLANNASNVKIVGNRIFVSPSGDGINANLADFILVARNVVIGDGSGLGIVFEGSNGGDRVTGNVVAGTETGMLLSHPGIAVTGNVVIGNEIGIYLDTSGSGLSAKYEKNMVVGNLVTGFYIYAFDSSPTTVALGRNNVFGNGELSGSSTPNCGIVAKNDDVIDGLTVDATGVFWGAASGPGGNPADTIGGACNVGPGSETVNAPSPAPKKMSVKAAPQR